MSDHFLMDNLLIRNCSLTISGINALSYLDYCGHYLKIIKELIEEQKAQKALSEAQST